MSKQEQLDRLEMMVEKLEQENERLRAELFKIFSDNPPYRRSDDATSLGFWKRFYQGD